MFDHYQQNPVFIFLKPIHFLRKPIFNLAHKMFVEKTFVENRLKTDENSVFDENGGGFCSLGCFLRNPFVTFRKPCTSCMKVFELSLAGVCRKILWKTSSKTQ